MYAALGSGEDLAVPSAIRSRHSSGRQRRSSTGAEGPLNPSRRLDYRKSNFELPLSISKKFRDVQFKTLVGLAPLVPAAWYSVDDAVYLWRFRDDKEVTRVIQCDGVVTAVALGLPTPGVFPAGLVKFLLCVATENSVSLVGLDADLKQVKLDGYFLSVPQSTVFTQAAVSLTGRVMLWTGSDPATVYEVRYRSTATWFKSRVYFHYHSLLLTSGSSGIVASVFSKLVSTTQNIFGAPRLPKPSSGSADAVRLFIQADSTFRFFVSVDAVNVSLHELSPAPTSQQAASASWRHSPAEDVQIRCVGRTPLADSVGLVARVVAATVTVCVDTEEPLVHLVTDTGDLVTLRNSDSGELVIAKTRSQASESDLSSLKKQRTSFGGSQSVGSLPVCSVGVVSEAGGAALLVTGQGTRITVSSVDACSEFEANGSVLAVATESAVETDSYGAFVLPGLTVDAAKSGLIPPSATVASLPLIILTGKGVSALDPIEPPVPTGALPPMPQTVSEVVRILCSPPAVTFAFKPMFIRAISDDVAVSSMNAESDFCNRERAVKPLSGGVWIGGVQKLSESLLFVLRHEPVLVLVKGGVRVGIAQAVLESVSVQISHLVKFVRIVLSSLPQANAVGLADSGRAFRRRDFMHGSSVTREQVVKSQAIVTLEKLANQLASIGETIALFALVAEYQSTAVSAEADSVALGWTVADFATAGSAVLSRICGRLIQANADRMTSIVDELKKNSPSVLCTVSPSLVPFSPEGIAAMLQCAVASGSPAHVLLDAVKTLARGNPNVSKTLVEVGKILNSLQDESAKESVVVAALDGVQERLIDEAVVGTVLAWAGSSLGARLNEFILDYLFTRGNSRHIHLAAGSNQWVEKFLAARLTESRVYAEVYANLLVRTGRNQAAGDALEKLAFNSNCGFSTHDRIQLLEQANAAYGSSKRFEHLMIAKCVQLRLLHSLEESKKATSNELSEIESNLLSISDLHYYAKEFGCHDVLLVCFLFAHVKEAEVVKTWTNCLFEDFSFFTSRRGTTSVQSGIVAFLKELHAISVSVDSFTIWKKPELIAAMLVYIDCLLSGGKPGWVGSQFLQNTLRLGPFQAIETLVKVLREVNVWMAKMPHTSSDYVSPSADTVRDRIVDEIISIVQIHEHDLSSDKLLSLMILVKNFLKTDNAKVAELIGRLSATAQDHRGHHATLAQ